MFGVAKFGNVLHVSLSSGNSHSQTQHHGGHNLRSGGCNNDPSAHQKALLRLCTIWDAAAGKQREDFPITNPTRRILSQNLCLTAFKRIVVAQRFSQQALTFLQAEAAPATRLQGTRPRREHSSSVSKQGGAGFMQRRNSSQILSADCCLYLTLRWLAVTV